MLAAVQGETDWTQGVGTRYAKVCLAPGSEKQSEVLLVADAPLRALTRMALT
jgi:hypothetical protein